MNKFIRHLRSLRILLDTLLAVAFGSEIYPKAQSVKQDCPEPAGY